jgi:hypothetical protein
VVDISLGPLGTPVRWRAGPKAGFVSIAMGSAFLLLVLVALTWVWSVATTNAAQRKCDAPIGKLAVRLKLDIYYSNCRCMKHSLDFGDPCNSMYIPLLF